MFCHQTVCGEMATSTTSSRPNLCACDVLLMDGTFKSCLFSLLCPVIHCFRISKRHLFSAGVRCSLKQRSDQLTYEFLFSRIIDQCNSVHLILRPRTVITDFENAAINAVSTIFQNTHRRGRRFPPRPVLAQNSDPNWYVRRLQRQELGYFEVVGFVFRTVCSFLMQSV